jgi:DNA-binding NtrC family response regulator
MASSEPFPPTKPASPGTVLIVDDVSANVGVLGSALELAGYRVLAALSGASALKAASKARPDLILLDVLMPEMDGIETCRRLKADAVLADTPVVFVTANDEMQSLVEGFRAGGVDYVRKPFQIDEVLARVGTHLRLHRLARDLAARTAEVEKTNASLRTEIQRREAAEDALKLTAAKLTLLTEAEARRWGLEDGFVGRSPLFGKLLQQIRSVQAFPRTNVLLTGESGTGKELVARAIHFGGAQGKGPFIAVNCSALPIELAESHFFGHVRGAFTGAIMDRKGYFELADGGTLFLDEIGDMPLPLQAKLLRVLEDGQVTPVGATKGHAVSVRIIAATHVDLPAKVAAGAFRQDLYYRLAHFHVAMPPLRERREDIPALAAHFVRIMAVETGRKPPVMSADALDLLVAHRYPGNIRELKNTLERALIYAGGEGIRAEHIVFTPLGAGAHALAPALVSAESHAKPESAAWDDLPLNLAEAENRLIARALETAAGNVSAAARLLGVNRAMIYRWQERRAGKAAVGAAAPSEFSVK